MFAGYLKPIVIFLLSKKEHTGYDLIKNIEDLIGQKPSPGSIYPLLHKLTKDNLISVSISNRKKIYKITKEGKEEFNEMLEKKKEIMSKMHNLNSLFSKDSKKINAVIKHSLIKIQINKLDDLTSNISEKNKKKALEILKKTEDKLKSLNEVNK